MNVVELSGGVGGARLARGLSAIEDLNLTVIVNVGDDETIHGLRVSPDIDTVIYTLAGVEGPEGWGRRGDTFVVNDELGRLGTDNRFRLGDLDLALNLYRTQQLAAGEPLARITDTIRGHFGIVPRILPATEDPLRTEVRVPSGEWLSFQEYFVLRQHRDEVVEVRFAGATESEPAPGVIDSIVDADVVIVAPSNPPLSIWPILIVPGLREAVALHPRVIAISPLFGGKALKGPADRVMGSLGLQAGNRGVVEAYEGLLDILVIDKGDAADAAVIEGISVVVEDTLIKEASASARLGRAILGL
ncbi:MAG TPA: 2-phospho-L-lactate transferase [Acidimicrobiia bacterium]|nr:2-phospho-L-lactate transferase [Acidimicrobiia bacterium]